MNLTRQLPCPRFTRQAGIQVNDEGFDTSARTALWDQPQGVGVMVPTKNPVRPEVSKGARGRLEFK
jgi:hypothetical protein